MSRVERADELHHMNYNCAQSVALAYADKLNADPKTVFRAMEGFGAGMGGMQETCGAVTGAVAVAGLLLSSGDLDNPNSKGATYRIAKQIPAMFRERNGATVCKELKGVETGKVLRPCADCIADACRILEELFPELAE